MIKKLLLPLAGVGAFVVLVGLLYQGRLNFTKNQSVEKKIITLAGKEVEIKLADSSEERARGLGSISSLGQNEGMLFVFDSKDVTPTFWMKGMLIPIDIIWIDNGRIVKIDKNASNTDQTKLYTPGRPIDYVLEVNAGFADQNGLKLGDSAEGDPIKN